MEVLAVVVLEISEHNDVFKTSNERSFELLLIEETNVAAGDDSFIFSFRQQLVTFKVDVFNDEDSTGADHNHVIAVLHLHTHYGSGNLNLTYSSPRCQVPNRDVAFVIGSTNKEVAVIL